jgi:hypothetical protein
MDVKRPARKLTAAVSRLTKVSGSCRNNVRPQRAPKRALKVFRQVGKSWRQLKIVRLISARSFDNLLASAALREVTAAERFRRVSDM